MPESPQENDGESEATGLRSVGCAFLSRGSGLTGHGHACVDGGESFKFFSVDELHQRYPDTVWISSATPNRFISDQGLRKPWLRHGSYFQSSITSIADELGLDPSDHGGAATAISAIIGRTAALATHHIPSLDFPGPQGLTFADAICGSIYGRPKPAAETQEVLEVLKSTFHPPLPPYGEASSNDLVIRIPVQRVAHMERVLSIAVPTGNWKEINLAGIGDARDWMLSTLQPALALTWISKPHAKLSRLIPKASARGIRVWLPFPEFAVLSGCAEVKIDRILVADEYVSCSSGFRVPPPVMSPIDHAAISSGLFAESYLGAICNMAPRYAEGNGTPARYGQNTARSAWMLSAARAFVFTEAAKLMISDFNVISYGISDITLAVPKSELSRLRNYLANANDLLLPAKYLKGIGTGLEECQS